MNFDLLTATVLPGDVLRVDRNYFVLVITKDRHDNGRGFYYARCTFDGVLVKWAGDRISAANYINHSNMIMIGDRKDRVEIVNCIDLTSRVVFHNCNRYEWHLTGDAAIDAYMSNLDARYSLFVDASTELDLARYARNEDRNNHSENGSAVAEFAFYTWLRKCRDANLMKFRLRLNGGAQ